MYSQPRNPMYQHVDPTMSVDSLFAEEDEAAADCSDSTTTTNHQHPAVGYKHVHGGQSQPVYARDYHQSSTQPSPGRGPRVKRPRPSFWQWLCAIWMYGWVAEILSCLLSIASLTAMIVVLQLYQNKPLPEWPMGITINALISIFSVLLKTGVTIPLSEGLSHLKWQWFSKGPRKLIDLEEFDAASRGPWGAFLFLFRFESSPKEYSFWARVRSRFRWTQSDLLNNFAKLSALLTVMGFAVDPFTQQVLEYSMCRQLDNSSIATLARTNMYWAPGDGKKSSSQEFTEDFEIAWAINIGLAERPEVPSFQCPTGNCTFPEFSTVGVCHTCVDISDRIQNLTGRLPESDTTPVNNYAPYAWFMVPENNKTNEPKLELERGSFLQSDYYSKADVDRLGDTFISISMISVPYDAMAQTYGSPNAALCDLNPCVRTFSSEVVSNNLSESEIDRVYLFRNHADPQDSDHLTAVPAGADNSIIPATAEGQQRPSCDPSDRAAPGLIQWRARDEDPPRWYPAACVFSFSYYSNHNAIPHELMYQLADLWHGPSYMGSLQTLPRVIYGDSGVVDIDRMNFVMGNVADSMTASMRSRGGVTMDSAGEYVSGTAYSMVTCANVRWHWLIFSVVLVFLAAVWLVILI